MHLGHYVSIQKPLTDICKSLNANDQPLSQFRRSTLSTCDIHFTEINRYKILFPRCPRWSINIKDAEFSWYGNEIHETKFTSAPHDGAYDSLGRRWPWIWNIACCDIYIRLRYMYQRYSKWTKHDALLPLLDIYLHQDSPLITSLERIKEELSFSSLIIIVLKYWSRLRIFEYDCAWISGIIREHYTV